jgi:predicted RNase H-related nuclease YkuK (DUF458 family)
MKSILKFLLNTEVGKLLIQALVKWIIEKVKIGLEKAKQKGIPADDALDIIHDEIHADVRGKNVTDLI